MENKTTETTLEGIEKKIDKVIEAQQLHSTALNMLITVSELFLSMCLKEDEESVQDTQLIMNVMKLSALLRDTSIKLDMHVGTPDAVVEASVKCLNELMGTIISVENMSSDSVESNLRHFAEKVDKCKDTSKESIEDAITKLAKEDEMLRDFFKNI